MFPSTSCATPSVNVRNGAIGSAMSSAAPTGHFHIQVRYRLGDGEGILRKDTT